MIDTVGFKTSQDKVDAVRDLSRAWLSMDVEASAPTKSPIVKFADVPQLARSGPSMETSQALCGATASSSYCQCPSTICSTFQNCIGTRNFCGC